MTELRAVAWDIDGTLADSEGLHYRALLAICAEYGADLGDLPDQAFSGVHMLDVWTALRPRLPNTLRRQDWLTAVEDYYVARVGEITPMPGAIATVRELAKIGIAQACVSNSGRRVVNANIAALGIGDVVAFSISLDDVTAGKPHPEPYLSAARRWELPPQAIVAVEDSEAGAMSARAAGLMVVRYGTTGGGVGDRWIIDLSKLIEIFAR